jgi:hypothetical protein
MRSRIVELDSPAPEQARRMLVPRGLERVARSAT